MYFMETSARTGDQIQDAIQILLNGTVFTIFPNSNKIEIHKTETLDNSTSNTPVIQKGAVLPKNRTNKSDPNIEVKLDTNPANTEPDCQC
jgi:hypothetical protein